MLFGYLFHYWRAASCLYIGRLSNAETPIESTPPVPSDFALQHDHANASHLFLIRQVALIDSAGDRCRTVVVDVVVKLAVTSAELELLEEERVVVESESVENIEFGLELLAFLFSS